MNDTHRVYRPRRAGKRWLEGAPEYILSVHYTPRYADCYTMCFGGTLWEPGLGRDVMCLAMSHEPEHPQGVSMWGQMRAYNRNAMRKIRWLDLPEHIRKHVVRRATETN